MKVTIDTKEDTQEDIRRVLHILTDILHRKGTLQRESLSEGQTDTTNLMSMFNAPPGDPLHAEGAGNSGTAPSDAGTAPDFSSFLNLAGRKEEIKAGRDNSDNPEVEFY